MKPVDHQLLRQEKRVQKKKKEKQDPIILQLLAIYGLFSIGTLYKYLSTKEVLPLMIWLGGTALLILLLFTASELGDRKKTVKKKRGAVKKIF